MKTLIVILLFVSTLVLIAQIDDELSSQSNELMAYIETPVYNEAYFYLLGFYANKNDEPADVGKALFKQYQQLELNDSYQVVEYEQAKKLPLPSGELFCRAWEEGCLALLFSSDLSDELQQTDYQVLLARVNHFHQFNHYQTLTKPLITEVFPPLQYLRAAERIKVLHAIKAHQAGNSQGAITALQQQLSTLRKFLALQDNLIGKVFFLMKAAEVVDVLSVIGAQSQLNLDTIKTLSHEEKDLSKSFAREFAMSFYMLKALDRDPEIFHLGDDFPGWITRILYKPNMTVNANASVYTQLGQRSLLTPAQFAKTTGADISGSKSFIRNYIGSVLTDIALPNFDEYIARFMDFDAKVTLFNHLYGGVDKAKSPYDKNEPPIKAAKRVCFNGPLQDDYMLRCVTTKI
ncbi:hypothetical protein GCM10009111_27160 [Colwellia asteriadis]|uniref:Uncharacterized protein n=1 Tax=Colwellia asteriadis TaxID=517723 RepID=A0ABN1L9F2_9GAMM